MSTGLTFGTISALFGLTNHVITQTQHTVVVTTVIGSAVVPRLIAHRFWRLVLVMTAACAGSAPLSPPELTALSRAEARWKARPFADYRYEMQQRCFCPPELGRWTRVTVRQGNVVAAERVEPDSTSPMPNLALWAPIDSLFSRLRQFARDQSHQDVYRDIVVEFDPALGFPTRVEWLSRPTVQDAGATYLLRNVQPQP